MVLGQGSFDELGLPLREVTFVVVDLETTGASPVTCRVTEIGAVKVRGGEVLGEFATLVNPEERIPPFIAVLTGITDQMVASAPRLDSLLAAFFEFCGSDAVLVAHNAPFDVGFLQAACHRGQHVWPRYPVIDTARLARAALTRDEAPNCKLATLARLFRSPTTPSHRALEDARATVHVLHGLLERVGTLGVTSLEELSTFTSRVSPELRRKRHLAEAMPDGPGVYVFRDGAGRALYVGKSGNLRSRVRTYFTASERRSRMAEMVGLATRVEPIPCATALEAEVRELRLIAEAKPRYNRRSRFPERAFWLKLTAEAFPRLSIVRELRADGGDYLGPFASTSSAEQARDALHEAVPLRQCTSRLSSRGRGSTCALYDMGRCGAPCAGLQTGQEYAPLAATVRSAFFGDVRAVVHALLARVRHLAGRERYEDAAAVRDRLSTFLRVASRMERIRGLSSCQEIVAARRTPDLGWELVCVRWGRLAGAGLVPRGADPWPHVSALVATAEAVEPAHLGPSPCPAASAEEVDCVVRWLEGPGTRLVSVAGEWVSPAFGAGSQRHWLDACDGARASSDPLGDHRGLRPQERPPFPRSRASGPSPQARR